MKGKFVAVATLFFGFACTTFGQGPAGSGTKVQDSRPAQPEQPAQAAQATEKTTVPAHRSCLIVTSAEGHRARNAAIFGVLTGGIGLAAGALASGAKYEYRDNIDVPPSLIKMKYKGKELLDVEKEGIHVVVIRKNPKGGGEADEIKQARESCKDQ